MKNLLLVEDDVSLREGLTFALEKQGYKVIPAGTVTDALRLFDSGIRLVILELVHTIESIIIAK